MLVAGIGLCLRVCYHARSIVVEAVDGRYRESSVRDQICAIDISVVTSKSSPGTRLVTP